MRAIVLAFACALTGALALPGPAAAQTSDPALEARIARIEAVQDIERLLHEYARAVDEGDFDAFVDAFAEDGEWVGGLGAFRGRAAIRAMLEDNMRPGPRERLTSFHIISNAIIDLAEDARTARAISRWSFFVAGPDGQPAMLMSGRYFDDLVHEDGAWRFLRREAPSDIPFNDLSDLAAD